MNFKTFLSFFGIVLAVLIIYNVYPEQGLPKGVTIDKILVDKSDRKLIVFSKGEQVKVYTISLGDDPIGHKEFEGDERTPEGIYEINDKNPGSGYHKNLGVSYPNNKDKEHAKLIGKSPGGDIKIHGLRNGLGFINKFHRWFDWTNGCMALTDSEVDELYNAVPIGTLIEIRP